MSNRDQIKARIERDKARKAKKQYERAHGTWRAQFNIDLDGLKMRFNEVLRSCPWMWDKNCTHKRCIRKRLRSVETIKRLNLEMSVEDRLCAIQPHGEFKWVFTIQNLKKSLQKRRKGVTWKGNVQRFLFHAVLELKRLKDGLLRGELKVDKSIRLIVLHERGKLRKVHAVMIDCRTVQGCLCDSSLIPLTKHKLIRDNPASVKGRGITDARNRMVLFFCELAKKYLDKFYLMSTDFKSFFDSIRHQDCLKVLRESQADLWIQGLGMKINRMYQESELDQIPDPEERAKRKYMLEHNRGIGLTLGSQESQIMAVLVPSPLDHAVKEGANSLRAYERYIRVESAFVSDELLGFFHGQLFGGSAVQQSLIPCLLHVSSAGGWFPLKLGIQLCLKEAKLLLIAFGHLLDDTVTLNELALELLNLLGSQGADFLLTVGTYKGLAERIFVAIEVVVGFLNLQVLLICWSETGAVNEFGHHHICFPP